TDGEQAWSREGDSVLETAPVGAGANRLSARAVYGYLPEFVEREPLWRERSLATEVGLLESTTVDGEPCDVVRVAIELDRGETSEIVWTIARTDRLPRRGRWVAEFTAPEGMVFTLTDLRTGLELPRSFFAPPTEPDAERVATVGVGDVVPAWTLPRPGGGSVSSEELSGQVVVLDFWNTWCPTCRSIAPATHELARRLEERAVRFFGVNIFETGDPVAYWEETAPPYPMLLEGEELGRRLDLPWQPGIAVVGPDGILLHKQLGASPDRLERVLEAVEKGLSQRSGANTASR
ncbi:MAG: TlpA disulfide reductase family protein, partial [Thermoanaerobaculia bacterium]|nr:TlpA disulfide reductase family protein [Thermoanaerobaculia bacterium]